MIRLAVVAAVMAFAGVARADVDAVAWKPGVAGPGTSPELVVAYSTNTDQPRFTFITIEIKDAAGVVVAGDLVVIDSFAPPVDVSFGWYTLPPGEYRAIAHCTGGSSAFGFTVTGMAPPPPPGGLPVK